MHSGQLFCGCDFAIQPPPPTPPPPPDFGIGPTRTVHGKNYPGGDPSVYMRRVLRGRCIDPMNPVHQFVLNRCPKSPILTQAYDDGMIVIVPYFEASTPVTADSCALDCAKFEQMRLDVSAVQVGPNFLTKDLTQTCYCIAMSPCPSRVARSIDRVTGIELLQLADHIFDMCEIHEADPFFRRDAKTNQIGTLDRALVTRQIATSMQCNSSIHYVDVQHHDTVLHLEALLAQSNVTRQWTARIFVQHIVSTIPPVAKVFAQALQTYVHGVTNSGLQLALLQAYLGANSPSGLTDDGLALYDYARATFEHENDQWSTTNYIELRFTHKGRDGRYCTPIQQPYGFLPPSDLQVYHWLRLQMMEVASSLQGNPNLIAAYDALTITNLKLIIHSDPTQSTRATWVKDDTLSALYARPTFANGIWLVGDDAPPDGFTPVALAANPQTIEFPLSYEGRVAIEPDVQCAQACHRSVECAQATLTFESNELQRYDTPPPTPPPPNHEWDARCIKVSPEEGLKGPCGPDAIRNCGCGGSYYHRPALLCGGVDAHIHKHALTGRPQRGWQTLEEVQTALNLLLSHVTGDRRMFAQCPWQCPIRMQPLTMAYGWNATLKPYRVDRGYAAKDCCRTYEHDSRCHLYHKTHRGCELYDAVVQIHGSLIAPPTGAQITHPMWEINTSGS